MRLANFNILHGRSPVDGLVDLDRFVGAVRTLRCAAATHRLPSARAVPHVSQSRADPSARPHPAAWAAGRRHRGTGTGTPAVRPSPARRRGERPALGPHHRGGRAGRRLEHHSTVARHPAIAPRAAVMLEAAGPGAYTMVGAQAAAATTMTASAATLPRSTPRTRAVPRPIRRAAARPDAQRPSGVLNSASNSASTLRSSLDIVMAVLSCRPRWASFPLVGRGKRLDRILSRLLAHIASR